jgi:hypothetical protein
VRKAAQLRRKKRGRCKQIQYGLYHRAALGGHPPCSYF